MNIPSLVEMLKAGVHFGHQTSKRHPNMEPYIFTARQKMSIINLEETEKHLVVAADFVRTLAAQGKTVLFVGTKKQAQALVKKHAEACGMPYVTTRWLGGLLTNFKNVSSVPRTLTRLKKEQETGELKKYTKKEQLEFSKEIERLSLLVGGLETLMKLPDAVLIVDLKEEKTALRESNQMHVPVVALCDTNVDPIKVEYPIPANDDAIKSIDIMLHVLSTAIQEGKAQPEVTAPVVTETAAPQTEQPTV